MKISVPRDNAGDPGATTGAILRTDCHELMPRCAYVPLGEGGFRSTGLTRGPWHPDHQHAGPPIALACRAIERAAAELKLTHISRLTANLLRPVPICELKVSVATDYAGRNVAHLSASLVARGKEVARLTAVAQRESDVPLPPDLPGHPLPLAPRPVEDSMPMAFPFEGAHIGYQHLIETRVARGRFFHGPSAVWFRMLRPLVDAEDTSVYQRVAVAADSGNGISAILDFSRYTFVNSDLTVNLLRKPRGEWICIDARTYAGPSGGGLAESMLFDAEGLIGRATQSLSIRLRE